MHVGVSGHIICVVPDMQPTRICVVVGRNIALEDLDGGRRCRSCGDGAFQDGPGKHQKRSRMNGVPVEFLGNVFSATSLDRSRPAGMHRGVVGHIVGVAIDLNPTGRRRVVGRKVGRGDTLQTATTNPARSSSLANA